VYSEIEECQGETLPNGNQVIVAGFVTEFELKKTRKGEMMCKILLENNYDFLEVMVFQSEFETLRDYLTGRGDIIMLNGSIAYDKRKEVNILRANFETNIVTLTL
jgi:DNA polymerase III alpha subunit